MNFSSFLTWKTSSLRKEIATKWTTGAVAQVFASANKKERKILGSDLTTEEYTTLLSEKYKKAEDAGFCRGIELPDEMSAVSFSYIPLSTCDFAYIVSDIVKQGDFSQKSFIDVGCGVPIYSDFMKDLGCKEAHGLEYNTKIIKTVAPYYPDIELHVGDMLKYQDYGKYDILYSYNPLRNSQRMDDALLLIMEQMKIGSVLYFVPATVSLNLEMWGFERLTNHNIHNVFKFYKFTKILPFQQMIQGRIDRISPFLEVIRYYVDDGYKGAIEQWEEKEMSMFLSLLSYLDSFSLEEKKKLILEIERYIPIIDEYYELVPYVSLDTLRDFLKSLPYSFRCLEERLWAKLGLFLIRDLLEKSLEISGNIEEIE